MALLALHERDIIHCDVAPRNIIVGGRLDATLIDFGLARGTGHESKTRFAQDQFKAPEQCEEEPSVEKASDVFALGRILSGPGCDREPLSRDLRTLAERMTATTPGNRPTIREVVSILEGAVAFEPTLMQLRGRVDDLIQEAPQALWEELFRAQTAAALIPAGYLAWDVQRGMELSLVLNNLFVKIVALGASEAARKLGAAAAATASESGQLKEISLANVRPVLGQLRDSSLEVWKGSEVKAIGLLRNALAHPSGHEQNVEKAMRELSCRREQLPEAVRAAAVRVAESLDALASATGTPIRRFVEFYTGGTPDARSQSAV